MSIIKRVIRVSPHGEEYIISGRPETTFSEACLKDWFFKKTNKKSSWMICDNRGNDITHRSLETYDGIAILVSDFVEGHNEETPDKAAKYPSIHDSVEYYD